MNYGWQSESTDGRKVVGVDGRKGGWSCVFLEWLQWLQRSPGRPRHPQLLDVVWCSAAAVVLVVVWWSCRCGVV